ncbi:CRISPR-associated helicase Cas3' [Paenibacillus pasadenensis]|uniref:CRISPR-associated helicase Cas3' n=1 Tax=Paenibacillus pasadenensis TaxID=217090 RepID=UPI00203B0E07|nr:CRISPR-associated helicase Cas3' [Paenibacillus pasadenensis]MCM3748410.1 CRISPR-associated helicase Cas3' [Paenibacillus pasadenensis]
MLFYAHSRDDGCFQLLKEHLEEVAKLCRENADAFGSGELAYLAGLFHDIGKYSELFQQRVRGRNVRVDHSTAGMQWIMDKRSYHKYIGTIGAAKYLAQLVAMAVAGHHGGLQNYGTRDEDGSFMKRLSKSSEEIPPWLSAWEEIAVPAAKISLPPSLYQELLSEQKALLAWKYSFLGRMLYSCLVDADSIDTRNFTSEADRLLVKKRHQPSMAELLTRLNHYLHLLEKKKQGGINNQRRRIQQTCRRRARQEKRQLFTLSVPTGGGKTLSSMAFALEHAVEHKLRRIIYVIPFTSIIEQNGYVFRKALGDDAILEHHSNFNFEEYEENTDPEKARLLKLSAENWDAPVVVTTSVQFFESLFSNKRSKCRKLHQIAGSVIVIDEAQSLPRGYMAPCLYALQELVDHYNCSVVLCTATQPSWDKLGFPAKEIMDEPSPEDLMDAFERVKMNPYGSVDEPVLDETVVDWMLEAQQVLCIVNTRKHAKLLFERLKVQASEADGLYHLSGRMHPAHRQSVIKEIRERLEDPRGLPCRVVSTQLIEAGVDIDFPLVLRAMAGLDSIAQAAGRCNREGKPELGELRVYYPERHGMPSKGWMKETAVEAQHVLRYEENGLSLSAMNNYFDRIHGLNDNTMRQKTDARGIMDLLKSKNSNLEIPYEEIANRFEFIDGQMISIVIPFDPKAQEALSELMHSKYPAAALRKLQVYSVQVYQYELQAMLDAELLESKRGVLCLTGSAFYDRQLGLLQLDDL